jgi:hypothetical protein
MQTSKSVQACVICQAPDSYSTANHRGCKGNLQQNFQEKEARKIQTSKELLVK